VKKSLRSQLVLKEDVINSSGEQIRTEWSSGSSDSFVFNIVALEFSEFFARSTYLSTRSHLRKLHVNHTRANIRYNYFACRVVKVWNSLPADIVDFSSLCRFRRSLGNTDFSEFLIIQ